MFMLTQLLTAICARFFIEYDGTRKGRSASYLFNPRDCL